MGAEGAVYGVSVSDTRDVLVVLDNRVRGHGRFRDSVTEQAANSKLIIILNNNLQFMTLVTLPRLLSGSR